MHAFDLCSTQRSTLPARRRVQGRLGYPIPKQDERRCGDERILNSSFYFLLSGCNTRRRGRRGARGPASGRLSTGPGLGGGGGGSSCLGPPGQAAVEAAWRGLFLGCLCGAASSSQRPGQLAVEAAWRGLLLRRQTPCSVRDQGYGPREAIELLASSRLRPYARLGLGMCGGLNRAPTSSLNIPPLQSKGSRTAWLIIGARSPAI